jgi:hypothetical protein
MSTATLGSGAHTQSTRPPKSAPIGQAGISTTTPHMPCTGQSKAFSITIVLQFVKVIGHVQAGL